MKIIDKIIQKIGTPNLIDLFVNKISFSELQSLLIRIFQLKVQELKRKDILSKYKSNRFVIPSDVDPILHRELELKVFSLLPEDFDIIDLSPLAPLGTTSALTRLSQNNVISTIRNIEVAADTTNILALECATRRQKLLQKGNKSAQTIKLCSSQRLTRCQPFDNPMFSAHFNVLALCTSGKDEGNDQFEIKHLKEHMHFYMNVINNVMNPSLIKKTTVKLFDYDTHGNTRLIEAIKAELALYKSIKVLHEKDSVFGKNYYQRLRFMIGLEISDGQEFDVFDGGFTNWTSTLLNNKKERLLTSGFGTELLLRIMKTKKEDND